ncbi:MAG: NAD-dependent epimerase/dehydratase family protein, partial [bacterium]
LCDELIKRSKVICLDNFLTGDEFNITHLFSNIDFEFINHDITNVIDLEHQRELDKFKIEFQGLQEIYFLASPASPKAYLNYPIETMLANSLGLKNALDLAVKYKAKFLYASGPAVYGEPGNNELLKEDYVGKVDHLNERACHAEAQRFGEALVNNYRLKYDLDTKIVRIFNCYGPNMKLEDGRMIPEFIKNALKGVDLTIYGNKDSFSSYFFIEDLIKGIDKMMESGEKGPINLASEWKNNFSEVAEKIIKLTGSKSKIVYSQADNIIAVPQDLADITLAKENLGWFPVILLEEGIQKTIDYLSAQREILRPSKIKA